MITRHNHSQVNPSLRATASRQATACLRRVSQPKTSNLQGSCKAQYMSHGTKDAPTARHLVVGHPRANATSRSTCRLCIIHQAAARLKLYISYIWLLVQFTWHLHQFIQYSIESSKSFLSLPLSASRSWSKPGASLRTLAWGIVPSTSWSRCSGPNPSSFKPRG